MLSLEAIRAIRDLAGALVVTIPLSMLIYALHNRHVGGKHANHVPYITDEEIERRIDEYVAKYGSWEHPPFMEVKHEVRSAGSNPAQIITPVGKGEHGWIVRIDRRKLNVEEK